MLNIFLAQIGVFTYLFNTVKQMSPSRKKRNRKSRYFGVRLPNKLAGYVKHQAKIQEVNASVILKEAVTQHAERKGYVL